MKITVLEIGKVVNHITRKDMITRESKATDNKDICQSFEKLFY